MAAPTLRDHMAMAALTGLMASRGAGGVSPARFSDREAAECYQIADGMLAARGPQADQAGARVVEDIRTAMAGLSNLTGYGEDAVWRPANRAWEALRAAADHIETGPAAPLAAGPSVSHLEAALGRTLDAISVALTRNPRDQTGIPEGQITALLAEARRLLAAGQPPPREIGAPG